MWGIITIPFVRVRVTMLYVGYIYNMPESMSVCAYVYVYVGYIYYMS